jgi:MerR family transcriptional regulator, Zn(II)-responsive regulator of zntA
MTIGAVARLTLIPEKTIRFYEESGILPPPERTESGYRLYSSEDVRRLRLIRRASRLGVALRDIKDLVRLAFADSCLTFEQRLLRLIDVRLAAVQEEITALQLQQKELLQLRESLAEADEATQGCRADECQCCRFIDKMPSAT